MRLKGKTAVITGAGAGIGLACAELFCEEGANVILAEKNVETGTRARDRFVDRGFSCRFVETDVSQKSDVEAAINAAVETYGGLDIVYNNAGGSTAADGPVTEAAFEEFWNKMGMDLFGVWAGCHYALPHIIKRGGGAVINATSVLALMGVEGRDAYTTAKGGIISLTRSLAVEYARHNIRVNAIAPGLTTTERVRARLDAGVGSPTKLATRSLLGMIEPREIAYTVLFLASDEARKITGQTIVVDSGATIC